MLIHGNLPYVLDPGHKSYQDRFFEVRDAITALYARVMHVRGSDKATETMVTLSDIADIPVRSDPTGGIEERTFSERWKKTFTHVSYAAKTTISDDLWADMPDDMKSAYPSLYASAMSSTAENVAWGVLRDADTTVGSDGVATISDSHPLISGAVADNKATTALSADSISAVRAAMARWKTPQGRIIVNENAVWLVIPPELEKVATEALNARLIMTSSSGNDANAVQQYGFKTPLVCPWLTDENNWFVFRDPATQLQGFEVYIRQAPDFMSGDKREDLYKWMNGTMRMSAGVLNWRALHGSIVG